MAFLSGERFYFLLYFGLYSKFRISNVGPTVIR